MKLFDIFGLIVSTGVELYQGFTISYEDVTINLFDWLLGFGLIIAVAAIIGKILQ